MRIGCEAKLNGWRRPTPWKCVFDSWVSVYSACKLCYANIPTTKCRNDHSMGLTIAFQLHSSETSTGLEDTIKEMATEVQNSRSGNTKKTAEDLDEFLNKVRRGSIVSNEEIWGFAKLFNGELTLDNISRTRLVNM